LINTAPDGATNALMVSKCVFHDRIDRLRVSFVLCFSSQEIVRPTCHRRLKYRLILPGKTGWKPVVGVMLREAERGTGALVLSKGFGKFTFQISPRLLHGVRTRVQGPVSLGRQFDQQRRGCF